MINAGIIGLGKRGTGLLNSVLLKNADINVIAVCDLYEDRVACALQSVTDAALLGHLDHSEESDRLLWVIWAT